MKYNFHWNEKKWMDKITRKKLNLTNDSINLKKKILLLISLIFFFAKFILLFYHIELRITKKNLMDFFPFLHHLFIIHPYLTNWNKKKHLVFIVVFIDWHYYWTKKLFSININNDNNQNLMLKQTINNEK